MEGESEKKKKEKSEKQIKSKYLKIISCAMYE
jgi:hypothetical protein